MAKSLVIVESPAKARTINQYVGSDFVVKASMGHVRDLPEKDFGVDLDGDFLPTYQVLPSRRKVVGELKKAAEAAEAVYLATDLDREGEAIAWHLCHALGVAEDRAYRVVFNQITRAAVRAAFGRPGRIDPAKVNAQQARRILDRIVGYELSPLLWRLVTKGLSAGRVQSVAVRLVVDREREIAAFVPEEYWKLTATLAAEGRSADETARFTADLVEWQGAKFKAVTGEEAHAVVRALEGAEYAVAALRVAQRSESPPPPFITSTLQQQAATQLRLSTRNTMRIAQELYEGLAVHDEGAVGLITYMRTDSVHVAEEALTAARAFVGEQFGQEYLPEAPRHFKQRAGAQAAHEAVRPTDVRRTPESLAQDLSRDQHRLYQLIWRRFVASQMAAARYENTTARITAGQGVFEAKGRRVLFDGFRRVAGLASVEDQLLPPLAEGAPLDLVRLEPSQHFTEPPPRYGEASLVRALEREGIGRPSTYAPIVATIVDRGYVKLLQRRFHATDLGMLVTDLLVRHFERVMDVGFTRHMEGELDRIEEQGADWVAVLREFYEPFKQALETTRGRLKEIKGEIAKADGQTCPKCGQPLAYRWSRFGRFLGCTGYPKCDYVQRPEGADENESIDEPCPECGKPLAIKRSKFGRFVGCTGFPECRYRRRLPRPGETPAEGAEGSAAQAPARATSREASRRPKSPRQTRAEAALAAAEKAVGKGQDASPDAPGVAHRPPGVKRSAGAPERDSSAPEGGGAAGRAPHTASEDADSASREAVPPCEKCGSPMVPRQGPRGPFLGCSAYPKCRNTRPLGPDDLSKEAEGVTCPACGAPMVVRRSRHGPFLGCSKYPECKGTRSLGKGRGSPNQEGKKTATDAERAAPPRKKRAPKKTGVACSRTGCGGELVERRGPSGKFFGCSNFPQCTYTTQHLPAKEDSPGDES